MAVSSRVASRTLCIAQTNRCNCAPLVGTSKSLIQSLRLRSKSIPSVEIRQPHQRILVEYREHLAGYSLRLWAALKMKNS